MADYSGIFDYLDQAGNTSSHGSNAVPQNEDGTVNPGWKKNDNDQWEFDGSKLGPWGSAVTATMNGGDGGGYSYSVDDSKLPQSRFGGASHLTQTDPNDSRQRLFNPAMQYDDPNYGHVTDARNANNNQWSDQIGPIVGAALTMGAGSVVGAAGGLSGAFNAAQGIGQAGANAADGGGFNWGSLSGVAGSALGIPPAAMTAARLAMALRARMADRGS
jgi:hypothetical protein